MRLRICLAAECPGSPPGRRPAPSPAHNNSSPGWYRSAPGRPCRRPPRHPHPAAPRRLLWKRTACRCSRPPPYRSGTAGHRAAERLLLGSERGWDRWRSRPADPASRPCSYSPPARRGQHPRWCSPADGGLPSPPGPPSRHRRDQTYRPRSRRPGPPHRPD